MTPTRVTLRQKMKSGGFRARLSRVQSIVGLADLVANDAGSSTKLLGTSHSSSNQGFCAQIPDWYYPQATGSRHSSATPKLHSCRDRGARRLDLQENLGDGVEGIPTFGESKNIYVSGRLDQLLPKLRKDNHRVQISNRARGSLRPSDQKRATKQRFDAVNGVVSTSKLAPGVLPVAHQSQAKSSTHLTLACPLCGGFFGKKDHVRSHFPASVDGNGNPLGLRWDDGL